MADPNTNENKRKTKAGRDSSRLQVRESPLQVLQDVPEELKARTDTRGEASLRGHLKSEGDEQTGSQSYIPPDPKDDKALHTALDLIRGIQKNSAYPPNVPRGPIIAKVLVSAFRHRFFCAASVR